MPQPDRVGLFVTCLVDLLRPQVGFAAVRLLENAGCRVACPRAQTCCGQPAFNAGDNPTAAALARRTVAAFEGFDRVVVPSGSCAAHLRRQVPVLLAEDAAWRVRSRAFADKVFELTTFLDAVPAVAPGPVETAQASRRIAYHDSCAGLRELGIRFSPRRLLARLPGVAVEELSDRDVCCGFGGAFCVKFPEIAGRLARDKARAAQATGATELTGGDLGCLLHLQGMLHRAGVPMRVRHVAEILAGFDGPAIGEAEEA
ncbi:MAG: (Fe-S)-binding protein [Pseudomonadota bacterium]